MPMDYFSHSCRRSSFVHMGLRPTKGYEKGSASCHTMDSGEEPQKVESAVDEWRPIALSDPERAREQISVRQCDESREIVRDRDVVSTVNVRLN